MGLPRINQQEFDPRLARSIIVGSEGGDYVYKWKHSYPICFDDISLEHQSPSDVAFEVDVHEDHNFGRFFLHHFENALDLPEFAMSMFT